MSYTFVAMQLALALLLGMLALLEVGRRLGAYPTRKDPDGAKAGAGAMDGAVFGLMGLLGAFTFSGAASRFDTRRQLIVEETNDIGTAYLRLDLLPLEAQPPLRATFRRYVDARLAVYQKLPDVAAAQRELAESDRLQKDIWNQAVGACRAAPSPAATTLLLSALNTMIDITTTRTMAMQMHPPTSIFVMLFGLALGSALLAGYAMGSNKTRSLLHMCAFGTVTALAVYVILGIEFPRIGLISVQAFDQALVDLRASMRALVTLRTVLRLSPRFYWPVPFDERGTLTRQRVEGYT